MQSRRLGRQVVMTPVGLFVCNMLASILGWSSLEGNQKGMKSVLTYCV